MAQIYNRVRADGQAKVVVCGDFNDNPGSAPLAPLAATDLKRAATHPSFDDGGRPGTFGNCTKSENFDHIFLSPALYKAVTGGGIYRCGAWGGTKGDVGPLQDDDQAGSGGV